MENLSRAFQNKKEKKKNKEIEFYDNFPQFQFFIKINCPYAFDMALSYYEN